jgi:hypothetical protein
LKVQQVEQTCLFDLGWGRGQQLTARIAASPALTPLFQEWQQLYLKFYTTASLPITTIPKSAGDSPLRGRVVESGHLISPVVDWHARLVEAEAKLLYELHRWLRSEELYEIRAQIAQVSRAIAPITRDVDPVMNLFLTCTPLDLARLPWEAWEIGPEFAASGLIRIIRTPANIHAETGTSVARAIRRKARILVILGDDTGLNFQGDRDAVHGLTRTADVQFIGWQAGQPAAALKAQIGAAIADPQGWDVLFFAGHSNETTITGGELAIAPGLSMSVNELAPKLAIAKEQGLQFALFNSCSGLRIAESLIDLGLSQVAVMREPIHNRVAQEFLKQFLQQLAAYKDVHEALWAACQFLKLEKNLTYPSAHLIPSLFCHPDAVLFRIQPANWRRQVRQWLPTPREAIALLVLGGLSLYNPLQDALLNQRTYMQAVYRQLTLQVPPAAPPPVLLVQIDDKSIRRSGMSRPTPIDRSYLAKLVDQLTVLQAKIVGVDYILDRQQPGSDPMLGKSVRNAIAQHQTWFVFGTIPDSNGEEVGVGEQTGIASPLWSLSANIQGLPNYMRLPAKEDDCEQVCPFAYLLSLVAAIQNGAIAHLPQPALNRTIDLKTDLLTSIWRSGVSSPQLQSLQRSHLHPITTWSGTLNQLWLRPIIDFSIPPDQVYERLPAWQLLETKTALRLVNPSSQVVLIAAGAYGEAGVSAQNADYFPLPMALQFWRDRHHHSSLDSTLPTQFTGAEAHAYMIHHLLSQRLVVPIPDLWMVGLAAVLGKGLVLWQQSQQHRWTKKNNRYYALGCLSLPIGYGLLGLQLYISTAILLPWLLPSLTLWGYVGMSGRSTLIRRQ